jgi:hypothetical protein
MTRKLALFLALALLIGLPVSCAMFAMPVVDAPPRGPAAADEWWTQTIDRLPLNFLAVYAAASEVHLKNATTVTYVDWYDYPGTLGVVQHELRLPSPPPEAAMARIRERLQGFKPAEAAPERRNDRVIAAEECQGCSYPQAMDVWHEADQKINPAKLKGTAPAVKGTPPAK